MIAKVLRRRRERSRQIQIVAIQKTENITRRLRNPFVDCMDLATIFFAHPVGQMLFIALDDFDSFIRAATVDDDVFEIRILLIEYRQNRLFNKLSLIERRRNDAEFWRHMTLECAGKAKRRRRFGYRYPEHLKQCRATLATALQNYAPLALDEFSYQSIVFRSPSSSDVCARKPNFADARVVSSCLRGCPFGLSDCHFISP